jgi:hypothetical protein
MELTIDRLTTDERRLMTDDKSTPRRARRFPEKPHSFQFVLVYSFRLIGVWWTAIRLAYFTSTFSTSASS